MATSDKNTVVTQGFIDKLIDKIGKILKEQHALVERDEEHEESIELLLEKVSSVENNFEELTKSLAKGSYPLKLARSIKVASSSIKPHIVPVDLTKAQLIDTYNELVAVLSGYIIPVTLTPDSYRGSNSDEIILETTIKGNYWAITTIEEKQHKYWLLPNNNIGFNIYKLKTVENLFQLKGDYNSPESEFILQEPAILSLLPNNKQWKLLQPGVLLFGKNSKSVSSQLKPSQNIADDDQSKINKQVLSTLAAFQTKVEQLDNKITQLELQSEISQKSYQKEKQDWLSEKEALSQQIKKLAQFKSESSSLKTEVVHSSEQYNQDRTKNEKDRLLYKQALEQQFEKIVLPNKNDTNDFNNQKNINIIGDREYSAKINTQLNNNNNQDDQNEKIDLKTKISQFRQAYSQDKKLISDKIVAKVAISVETLEQITFNKPDVITLENTPHGKYWIIDYLGTYFLIPSEIDQITNAIETSLTVAKILFHLAGYYPKCSNYYLIRPAIVTKVSTNQWRLEEKGKFNFS
jgi:hypothetical protein